MIIESIAGNLKQPEYAGYKVDYVDFDWFEVNKKLHRKRSAGGVEVALRLGDGILTKGLRQDDVLAVEGERVLAVNLLPCEVLAVSAEEPHLLCRVCYEIGNRHAPLFWGEDGEMLTPYDEPMRDLLERLGATVLRKTCRLDLDRSVSAVAHTHTHTH